MRGQANRVPEIDQLSFAVRRVLPRDRQTMHVAMTKLEGPCKSFDNKFGGDVGP
jgi:hypothetical protein